MEASKKLYSQRAIAIATFFGGPAAAGYLMKKNLEELDKASVGLKIYITGIVVTILIFSGISLMPDHVIDKVPNSIIPAIYTLIVYLIAEKMFGQTLKDHASAGGTFYNNWKAAGIGAVFMVILLAMIFSAVFIDNLLKKSNFDAATYDQQIDLFVENESASLAVFDLIPLAANEKLIAEFSNGLERWKQNKLIVDGFSSMQDMPAELAHQNQLLLRYSELRILQFEFFRRLYTEDNAEYIEQIDRLNAEIDLVLEKLSQ